MLFLATRLTFPTAILSQGQPNIPRAPPCILPEPQVSWQGRTTKGILRATVITSSATPQYIQNYIYLKWRTMLVEQINRQWKCAINLGWYSSPADLAIAVTVHLKIDSIQPCPSRTLHPAPCEVGNRSSFLKTAASFLILWGNGIPMEKWVDGATYGDGPFPGSSILLVHSKSTIFSQC